MPTLPQQLLKSLGALENFDLAAFSEAHNEENRITSIRLNPFKKTELDFQTGDTVMWNQHGSYLDQRPSFTHDPLFHAGCYYVQEAGSMFIEQALTQHLDLSQNLKVLDLCGAPGGKSTLINSLLNANSLLVANEIIKSRAGILSQNLAKWGTCNNIVTNNDPSKYSALPDFFDAMVVDAPCSGSGLFRKQPEAVNEWSEESVIACSQRQRVILAEALPALKTRGILIYSTCSFSAEENEDIVNWLCNEQEMEYLPLKVPVEWGITDSGSGYRFYPHLTKSEGFFCAVLRKTQTYESNNYHKKKNTLETTKAEKALLEPFLEETNFTILKKNDFYHFMNTAALEFLTLFEKQFYFKKAGTVIGEIKGRDVVPHQELAWSIHLSKQIQRAELSHDDALAYLRKQNFPVPDARGLNLITYKNHGLGWAKVLPNRMNNYLPNELRVLT